MAISKCRGCGETHVGGVTTCGDPYGDSKHVGLPEREWGSYCWDCYDKGRVPDYDSEITAEFKRRGLCGFVQAWVGRCRQSAPCPKHSTQKCWSCGEPATRDCGVAGSLVCGIPSCDEHPHEDTHMRRR